MSKKRMGRPRQDIQPRPIDHVEAFCCAQVERIERMFWRCYAEDYNGHGDHKNSAKQRRQDPGNRHWLMPQNDYMSRRLIHRDCELEIRK